MIRTAAIALVLALTACAAESGPCPTDQARNADGKCVALQESLPPGFVLDKPAELASPPAGYVADAPSKDEYIADQEAIAAFNREQEAKSEARRAREDAEWAADRRTDRVVEAQKETQQKLDAIADKL